MNYNTIKSLFRQLPLLKSAASPLLAARSALALRKENESRRAIEKLKKLIPGDVIIEVPQFNGTFELSVDSDLFFRLFHYSDYESNIFTSAMRLLDTTRDAIDIGANVGFFTVALARRVAPRRVLAVEPSSKTADRLERNLLRNGAQSSVILYRGAAADRAGELILNTIPGREEYSSIGDIVHPSALGSIVTQEKVQTRTIDSLVSDTQIAPGFLKVDVEGAERLVFEGARDVLKEFKPVILSELSDPLLRNNGSSSKDVVQFLRSFGYDVQDAEAPNVDPGSQPFSDIICTFRG